MNLSTYDSAQFKLFLFMFFVSSAILNIGYGYLSGKTEYLYCGLLLIAMSICTYRLFKIYSKDVKEKAYKQ